MIKILFKILLILLLLSNSDCDSPDCETTVKNSYDYPIKDKFDTSNNDIYEIYDFIGLDTLTTVCHRGANAYHCPENSIYSITQAHKQGFKVVECDVRLTSDNIPVIMHDASINRTMNNAKDEDIRAMSPIKVSSLTWEQLSTQYIYKTSNQEYKTRVTTFHEWIERVSELDLIPFLHNVPTYLIPQVQKYVGDNFIWMGSNISACLEIRSMAPGCFIMYQNAPEEDKKLGKITDINGIIKTLKQIGGMAGYSSMEYKSFSDEFIKALKDNGFYWQYSAISPNASTSEAIHRGVDFVLTNNWCNNKLSYRTIYRMEDSTILKSNDNVTISFNTMGTNVRVIVALKGEVTMSIDGAKSSFGTLKDSVEKYEFGINTIKQDLSLNIKGRTKLVIQDLEIQESY